MTLDDIDRLCDELRRLIEAGPGQNDAALRRVREIASEIHDHSMVSHTREKLVDLTTNFSIWLSHHKWYRYGIGGERLRKMLVDDLEELCSIWSSFEGH
jgi:hypothetical protein